MDGSCVDARIFSSDTQIGEVEWRRRQEDSRFIVRNLRDLGAWSARFSSKQHCNEKKLALDVKDVLGI